MKLLCWIGCVATFWVSVAAGAQPVTVFFSGNMDAVPPGFFDPDFPGIGVGSRFVGFYTIDPNNAVLVCANCIPNGESSYTLFGASGTVFMEGHSFPLFPSDSSIYIGDNTAPPGSQDYWLKFSSEFLNWDPEQGDFGLFAEPQLSFFDFSETQLTSENFFVPTSTEGWDLHELAWFRNSSNVFADIEIDTVLLPEPEQPTALALAFGLIVLLDRRRRQR